MCGQFELKFLMYYFFCDVDHQGANQNYNPDNVVPRMITRCGARDCGFMDKYSEFMVKS